MKTVIIGSGVVGATATYELARAGVDVTLVDSNEEGRASSAGAGIICPWSSKVEDPDWYVIASAGAEFYPELRKRLDADGVHEFDYRKVGSLRLTTDENVDSDFSAVSRRAKASDLAGEVSVITGQDAKAKFPPLEHNGPVIHIPGAARLDGRSLRDSLRAGAAKHGAKFVNGRARIEVDSQVRGATVNDTFYPADVVIESAGAWSPQLLKPLGIVSAIRPQRGQITHLGLPGVKTRDWSVLLPMSSHYLLAFDDSRVVVGATREVDSGFDYRLTAAGIHEVLDEALSAAPGLTDATYLETRIGFRPVGPDIKPLLGDVDGIPGLITANGLGASGLTMGPYVGSVAALLARGEDTDLDLAAYDPLRLPAGERAVAAVSA